MSGADKIVQKIIGAAQTQAAETESNAKAEAAQIIDDARAQAERQKEEILHKAQEEAQNKKQRLIAGAELNARKDKLRAKQEVVEQVFAGVLNKIASMPAKKYEKILIDSICSAVLGTRRQSDVEILLSANDSKKVSNNFLDKIKEALAKEEFSNNIAISDKSAGINSGFIARIGDVEINNSFEAQLKMSRDQLETEVVNILFAAK